MGLKLIVIGVPDNINDEKIKEQVAVVCQNLKLKGIHCNILETVLYESAINAQNKTELDETRQCAAILRGMINLCTKNGTEKSYLNVLSNLINLFCNQEISSDEVVLLKNNKKFCKEFLKIQNCEFFWDEIERIIKNM